MNLNEITTHGGFAATDEPDGFFYCLKMGKDIKYVHIDPLSLCFEISRLTDAEFIKKFELVIRGEKEADWCVRKEYYHYDRRMLSVKDRNIVFEKFGNFCMRCGSSDKLEIDHVVPYSKGGYTSIENSQVLCRSCNSWKRDKHIDYR